jgi:hypothetical protein
MKIWAAFVLIPILFCVNGCEKHPESDLQKVDPSAAAAASPGK